MACDYELGKFTYLDQIQPIITHPLKRPAVIEIPDLSDQNTSSDELECKPIFETPSKGQISSQESVKRRLNGICTNLDSPNKKIAISEFATKSNIVDNISICVTKQSKKHLHNKLQKISKQLSKQSIDTTPSKQSKTTTQQTDNTIEITRNICLWYMCGTNTNFSTPELLHDHVLPTHIEPCEGQDIFMCQWKGCKVYNVPSSSYNGYKGHVLAHTKAKMYRCLIQECPAAFRTREGLAHHMEMQDNHFIIPSENKKQPRPKQRHKLKPRALFSSNSPHSKSRHCMDTLSPIRRSQRLHHAPSFKKYFIEQESDEEVKSKPGEFIQEPILLSIQRQAETMTSSDLLRSIRDQSLAYEDKNENFESSDMKEEFFEKCLTRLRDQNTLEFKVFGQRIIGGNSTAEFLCGFSKTFLDWITSEALASLIQSSLSLSQPDNQCIHSNMLRMRTNKRK
ncbi:Zinc finger protein AEBP2-like [Oopsacas minuta]|uniref:Zinc finger protein AEBP2-like n=1 Tax=Oopsacas minuta TaxID=111878 RepID=A0AAV7KDD7_9METZ|nr:Zinc finger protein AEBP2-like [Oopsacas minuta]